MSEQRMRIGILGDPNDVHVRRWCAGLISRGLEVCNICGHLPAKRAPNVEYLEFQVPRFGLKNPYRRSIRFRRHFQELFRRFDIVHVHHLHNWGIDESISSGGRLMVSTYGGDVLPAVFKPGDLLMRVENAEHTARAKQSALTLADHVTATSAYLAEGTANYGNIPREEIEVIHFGADLKAYCPRRPERTESGHVGFFGGFRRYKGAPELIDAAPLVWKHFPDCVFSLYGSSHLRQECEALVRSRGHQHAIRLHDFIPHNLRHLVPGVMDTFDVQVVPSTVAHESYCAVAVEAQAMQVPVVASRIGGLPDTVLDGRTGVLVEPESPQALADGICELLGDEPKRRRLGLAAREWVEKQHDWSENLGQMIDAYERVMAGYSRRGSSPDRLEAELAYSG